MSCYVLVSHRCSSVAVWLFPGEPRSEDVTGAHEGTHEQRSCRGAMARSKPTSDEGHTPRSASVTYRPSVPLSFAWDSLGCWEQCCEFQPVSVKYFAIGTLQQKVLVVVNKRTFEFNMSGNMCTPNVQFLWKRFSLKSGLFVQHQYLRCGEILCHFLWTWKCHDNDSWWLSKSNYIVSFVVCFLGSTL